MMLRIMILRQTGLIGRIWRQTMIVLAYRIVLGIVVLSLQISIGERIVHGFSE